MHSSHLHLSASLRSWHAACVIGTGCVGVRTPPRSWLGHAVGIAVGGTPSGTLHTTTAGVSTTPLLRAIDEDDRHYDLLGVLRRSGNCTSSFQELFTYPSSFQGSLGSLAMSLPSIVRHVFDSLFRMVKPSSRCYFQATSISTGRLCDACSSGSGDEQHKTHGTLGLPRGSTSNSQHPNISNVATRPLNQRCRRTGLAP